ncbi:MAG: hypothetical protein HRU26_07690 [Psychroserpens sp.]|nr:hypothetical protein [Psychroserpens sp.]
MSEKPIIPKWLKDLQENSWELELFISGGAIFTLFQMSDIWINWMENLGIISIVPGRSIYLLIGTIGIETLKLGFILHLLLRALWLSMVCINYVYPSGIKSKRQKLRKPFKDITDETRDLQKQIIGTDKLCGIVMYLSISSTFLLAGLMFSFYVVYSLPLSLNIYDGFGFLLNVVLLIFLLYLIDLVFAGLFRKMKYVSYIVYPFFSILDFLSLRVLFRKPAQLFLSNVPKWKFVLSLITFLSLALTLTYLNTYKIMHWPNVFDARNYKGQMVNNPIVISNQFYRSEQTGESVTAINIQSKIINSNFLELNIPYTGRYDQLIEALSEEGKKAFLQDVFSIKINNLEYKDLVWYKTYNQNDLYYGLSTVISIENLKNGIHHLEVSCSNLLLKNESISPYTCEDIHTKVPFWKDTLNEPKQ